MKQYVKSEPVLVGMGVTAFLGWLARFLVGNGVLPAGSAAHLIAAVNPYAVFIVLVAIAFAHRHAQHAKALATVLRSGGALVEDVEPAVEQAIKALELAKVG